MALETNPEPKNLETTVTRYRQHIIDLLSERERRSRSQNCRWPEYEVQAILDAERDRYLLLHVGWRYDLREFGCIVSLEIRKGKIWIQYAGSDAPIADRLVALGVPKEDMVLAFHEPEVRPYTGFGTGE